MSERSQLIARKEGVRTRMVQVRRDIDRERLRGSQGARRVRQLETQLEQLEAEERELRLAIDRTAPETPAA
jgi:chromosome segregation ATPase